MDLAKGYFRCDVVIAVNDYFEHSLKESLRSKRGIGSRFVFEDDTELPSDFKDNFLVNSTNNHDLGPYIAEKITDYHISNSNIPIFVCTYENSVLTNNVALRTQSDISNCISEEADQRIVRHAINCAKNGFERVDVLTVDDDVLILVIAYFPYLKSKYLSISVFCGTGLGTSKIKYYNVAKIAKDLSIFVCKALPFLCIHRM